MLGADLHYFIANYISESAAFDHIIQYSTSAPDVQPSGAFPLHPFRKQDRRFCRRG